MPTLYKCRSRPEWGSVLALVRTINCFPIVPNYYAVGACTRVSWCPDYPLSPRATWAHQRELKEGEREVGENAAACRNREKWYTARYILMQILYRILVLRERAIHFLSTRNSTSATATCLSRDVCIVEGYSAVCKRRARRYFGESLPPSSLGRALRHSSNMHANAESRYHGNVRYESFKLSTRNSASEHQSKDILCRSFFSRWPLEKKGGKSLKRENNATRQLDPERLEFVEFVAQTREHLSPDDNA